MKLPWGLEVTMGEVLSMGGTMTIMMAIANNDAVLLSASHLGSRAPEQHS